MDGNMNTDAEKKTPLQELGDLFTDIHDNLDDYETSASMYEAHVEQSYDYYER
ncbi:MAG: hypothetical protein NC428_07575 [Clostridium sp.]|nr:hypothetical protein [Clostridium sp.]